METYSPPSYSMPSYGAPSMVEPQYAGFWIRLGTSIIDSIILLVIGAIIGVILHSNQAASTGINTLIGLVYTFGFWLSSGQTLGNRVTNTKLVRENGDPVTFGTAFIRYLGMIVSAIPLGLGYFWVIWDPKKQTWHDKMAGTLMIRV